MTRSPPSLAWITIACSFSFVVIQLDVTIVNVALPHIGADLGGRIAGLQWVVDAYTLAFAALLLSAGLIGDRLGHRKVYLCGFALFALASAACGAAGDVALLVAARAVQGLGAALLLPSSLALLNEATQHDPPQRARAVASWTAAGGVSIAAGPVVGGLLIAVAGWRSIFLVNLPLCVVGAVLALRLPADRPDAAARRLDPAGQLLAAVTLSCLVGGVIEGGRLGFASPAAAGLLVVAGLAAIGFVAVEHRSDHPMLPLGFFRRRAFSAAVTFGWIVNLAYYGVVFVLSLYLQQTLDYSALTAGLAFLPLTAGFIASNLVSGRMVAAFGPRPPMIVGAVIAAAGYGLLAPLDAGSRYWTMLAPFLLIPAGMGLAVPAMTTTVLSSVERANAGIASGALNAVRQTGGAMGVAAYGAMAAGLGVVQGLRLAALLSALLLLAGAGLGLLVARRA